MNFLAQLSFFKQCQMFRPPPPPLFALPTCPGLRPTPKTQFFSFPSLLSSANPPPPPPPLPPNPPSPLHFTPPNHYLHLNYFTLHTYNAPCLPSLALSTNHITSFSAPSLIPFAITLSPLTPFPLTACLDKLTQANLLASTTPAKDLAALPTYVSTATNFCHLLIIAQALLLLLTMKLIA